MSDGDGGAGAFGPAPGVGDVQASLDELAVDGGFVYVLSPQEACYPLSSLLHCDLVELAPTHKDEREIQGDAGVWASVDPRNPGITRFVRDEDANPEPPQSGMAP